MSVASLSLLPAGTEVFLDANVFVYGLLGRSAECHELLHRCATEDIVGVTTLEVVIETTHKLMLAEACAEGITTKERASQLKRRSRDIARLRQYWVQTQHVLAMNVVVLGIDEDRLHRAHSERANYGLLTNDSLIVAAMRECGVTALASADADFDHVGGLTRYAPSDVPRVQ